ncbi:hypothetical protein O181_050251 [Austropuccinia psidii MF-1]|uniref:Uncharacterized protein n=1 Tax=Austropuccinia psidii MF-1 TaxID=1389203 RepID=A0A9Q3HM68_9BASI|nr:hypothetical protein [Austropuccinia psidii MF-1]
MPPNTTNTQMHVLEGPGSTQKISSKAIPQSKFSREFLLNPGWNPVESQEPLGQSQQPPLNIPSGSQAHILHLKARQSNHRSKLKILYASLPLVHEEKVTGCHHPYASKPRMGHARPSREKIMDDEDENMSQTQSETNGEPRRENFTMHEEGTWENSEFTHPQIPISQSMLDQSKMRKQRNQSPKAHNVSKHESQKEQQRRLKAEILENFHGMRSAVNYHCLFLLKVRDKHFSSLPAPPSTEESVIAI